MKVLSKFKHDCILYDYYITHNSLKRIMISDAEFLNIHVNGILVIVEHLKGKKTFDLSIQTYNDALNFLKYYIF